VPFKGGDASLAAMVGRNEPAYEVTVQPIGLGSSGIRAALIKMAAMTRKDSADSDVRFCAFMLTFECPQGDHYANASAIASRMRPGLRWKWVQDPRPFEFFVAPRVSAYRVRKDNLAWGDCDDFSLMQGAMLTGLGIRARYVAIATPNGKGSYSHVFCEAFVGGAWRSMDSLVPHSIPWLQEPITQEV
jgi:transglutaminase superfamily protein